MRGAKGNGKLLYKKTPENGVFLTNIQGHVIFSHRTLLTEVYVKLTKVTFTKLFEVEGAFGQEWVSPGGGGFPKHLIYSYDLKSKTIIFPTDWIITESGGTNEDNWKRTQYEFIFRDSCHTVLRHEYIKKVDFVEVEYSPKDFQPNLKLVVMTLRIPRRNKARADKLIDEYQTAKTIVAQRSMKSSMVIDGRGLKKRTFPQYLYEIVMHKSEWQDFSKQVYEQDLVPKTQRFAILVTGPVFPRQLANFKQVS